MIQKNISKVFMLASLLGSAMLATAATPAEWKVGVHYVAGTDVLYQSAEYVALQTHTAQVDWAPATTAALWKLISVQNTSNCAAVPPAPTSLVGVASGPTGATLTWAAPSAPSNCTITGYTIYQNGVSIGTSTSGSFTVGNLAPVTTYSFTVTASDSFGNSPATAAVSVTTPPAGQGPPCANIYNPITVYNSGMKASIGGMNYVANWWTQNQSPATNSGLAGSGQPWTIVGPCAACAAPPSVPTGLTSGNITPTRIALSWAPSTIPANCAFSSYTLLRNGAPAGMPTNSAFTANGLLPSTTYTFSVEATDQFGTSIASTPLTITTAASNGAPTRMFAPYIDMSMTATQQLATIQQQSGIPYFTLAFILSNGATGCTPYWGGTTPISNDTLPDGSTIGGLIASVRNQGADVIASFGGENGTELALSCKDPVLLQAAYQSVINQYGITMVDFDIEGGAVADPVSIHRRNVALVALKAANPGLLISYTLPVLPTGLDNNGLKTIQMARADGLAVDIVNVMAMDYGASVDNGGQMGLDAIEAAQNTYQQILSTGLHATVGITPMIGSNDTSPETFHLADATSLLNFAMNNPWVSRLAMWSVGRDNGSCGGYELDGAGLQRHRADFVSVLPNLRSVPVSGARSKGGLQSPPFKFRISAP